MYCFDNKKELEMNIRNIDVVARGYRVFHPCALYHHDLVEDGVVYTFVDNFEIGDSIDDFCEYVKSTGALRIIIVEETYDRWENVLFDFCAVYIAVDDIKILKQLWSWWVYCNRTNNLV